MLHNKKRSHGFFFFDIYILTGDKPLISDEDNTSANSDLRLNVTDTMKALTGIANNIKNSGDKSDWIILEGWGSHQNKPSLLLMYVTDKVSWDLGMKIRRRGKYTYLEYTSIFKYGNKKITEVSTSAVVNPSSAYTDFSKSINTVSGMTYKNVEEGLAKVIDPNSLLYQLAREDLHYAYEQVKTMQNHLITSVPDFY